MRTAPVCLLMRPPGTASTVASLTGSALRLLMGPAGGTLSLVLNSPTTVEFVFCGNID